MKDAGEKLSNDHPRLSEAIRDVKNAVADRDDVVVELRDAERMRLDILASELGPVFADVPAGIELFDFTISSGLRPRLWIDAVSHVGMGRDRRTYRFVRDGRMGRVVLAESSSVKPVAEQVIRYVAERLVERERMLDGTAEPALGPGAAATTVPAATATAETPAPAAAVTQVQVQPDRLSSFLCGMGLVAAGVLVGLAVSVVLLWDVIAERILGQ